MSQLVEWLPEILAVCGILGAIYGKLASAKQKKIARALVLGIESFMESMNQATVSAKNDKTVDGLMVSEILKAKTGKAGGDLNIGKAMRSLVRAVTHPKE